MSEVGVGGYRDLIEELLSSGVNDPDEIFARLIALYFESDREDDWFWDAEDDFEEILAAFYDAVKDDHGGRFQKSDGGSAISHFFGGANYEARFNAGELAQDSWEWSTAPPRWFGLVPALVFPPLIKELTDDARRDTAYAYLGAWIADQFDTDDAVARCLMRMFVDGSIKLTDIWGPPTTFEDFANQGMVDAWLLERKAWFSEQANRACPGSVEEIEASQRISSGPGSINGVVLDENGNGLAGAEVRVKNGSSGVVIAAHTDDTGAYRFRSLPADNYEITIWTPGFVEDTMKVVVIPRRSSDVTVTLASELQTPPREAGSPVVRPDHRDAADTAPPADYKKPCDECAAEAEALAAAEEALWEAENLGNSPRETVAAAEAAVAEARFRLNLCYRLLCRQDARDSIPEALESSIVPDTCDPCRHIAREIGYRRYQELLHLESAARIREQIAATTDPIEIAELEEEHEAATQRAADQERYLPILHELLERCEAKECRDPDAEDTAKPGEDQPATAICALCAEEAAELAQANQARDDLDGIPAEDRGPDYDEAHAEAALEWLLAWERLDVCVEIFCHPESYDPRKDWYLELRKDLLPAFRPETACRPCEPITEEIGLAISTYFARKMSVGRVDTGLLRRIQVLREALARCEEMHCGDDAAHATPPPDGAPTAAGGCEACGPEQAALAEAQARMRQSLELPIGELGSPAHDAALKEAFDEVAEAGRRLLLCEKLLCGGDLGLREQFGDHWVDEHHDEFLSLNREARCFECQPAVDRLTYELIEAARLESDLGEARSRLERLRNNGPVPQQTQEDWEQDVERTRHEVDRLEQAIQAANDNVAWAETLVARCEETRCVDEVPVALPADDTAPSEDEEPAAGGGGFDWRWILGGGLLLAIIIAIVLVAAFSGGGDDTAAGTTVSPPSTEQPDATPPQASSTTEAPPTTQEPAPASTTSTTQTPEEPAEPQPPAIPPEEAAIREIAEKVGLPAAIVDVVLDRGPNNIWSRQGAQGSDGPGNDITATGSAVGNASSDFNETVHGNTIYGCGTVADEYTVTCPLAAGFMPEGEHVYVIVELDQVGGENATYTYGLAFDDDADATDNYQAPEDFDWDFFGDTEFFYRFQITPDGERRVWTERVVDGFPVFRHSSTAVIAFEQHIVWIVPRDEIPGDPLAFRATAFRNEGDPNAIPDPATSAGDVSGEDPTAALTPIDTAAVAELELTSALPPDAGDAPQSRVDAGPDPDQFYRDALGQEFVDSVNAALDADSAEGLLGLIHPLVFAQFGGPEACVPVIEQSFLPASEYAITSPVVVIDFGGFPAYAAQTLVTYDTGEVPSEANWLATNDGHLAWAFACG